MATLAAHLAAAEDPGFGLEVRHTWQQVSADRYGVVIQITRNVSCKVVQARYVEGGVPDGVSIWCGRRVVPV